MIVRAAGRPVKPGRALIWVILAVGFLWLAILIVVTLSDYQSRGWRAVAGG